MGQIKCGIGFKYGFGLGSFFNKEMAITYTSVPRTTKLIVLRMSNNKFRKAEDRVNMEAEYSSEHRRSSEEEDKLGRSVKKYKETTGARQFSQPRAFVSYKDSLVGDIPGA